RYQGLSKVFESAELAELLGTPVHGDQEIQRIYRECPRNGPGERMSYVDMNSWLPDDLVVKADRMTMAASLELRVPFLDHKVVEFAWGLPVELKLRNHSGKDILKIAVSDLLPPDIIHRTKMGFPVPLDSWFRSDLTAFARDTPLGSG